MIRNIITLTLNDLATAFKNKTIHLILFIPIFVFFSLKLIDRTDTGFQKMKIGLVRQETVAPVILKALASANKLFAISNAADEEEGKRLLRENKLDGLLLKPVNGQNGLVLVVLKKESMQTLAIVEGVTGLQQAVEGKNANWISDIRPIQKSGIQRQTLPTWILMLVLLVGFIILPAQVAEEKESKLLLALLQTPMQETEWLIAKIVLGMTLVLVAVLALHLLGRFDMGNPLQYIAFIATGGFCFSAYGILLGFLCRSQASARTLGVIFYLPHLLPSALSDFSQKLTQIAPFLPSYWFYDPIRSILLGESKASTLGLEGACLLLVGFAAAFFTYRLIKRRWLM